MGYDFNFHVPKSVSVLYAMTEDERLLDAFRDSVHETMLDMESEMKTRVRKQGKNDNRTTGNMVWGEFIHTTSRPIDGVPDPHLHAHCFVFNTTFDEQERAWKAGQFSDLKRDASYFEALFHSRFAQKLTELGLDVERTKTGWELQGLSKETLSKFSRRTAQIEEEAQRKGITDPNQKAELGAKTRAGKAKNLSPWQLHDQWQSRLDAGEADALGSLAFQMEQRSFQDDPLAAKEAVQASADHGFERKSVVPERTLLADALKRSVGKSSADTVHHQFQSYGFLTANRDGRKMATTRNVLVEERSMLNFARRGRGTCRPFRLKPHEFRRTWLNAGQRKTVEHILGSRDRVILIRGAAGVGKTSMMQEAVEAIEASGTNVFTFAPSAPTIRGKLQRPDFRAVRSRANGTQPGPQDGPQSDLIAGHSAGHRI
ncbi:MobF family relaxase [Planctomicrobium sp. SH527]|uniref:MobF family relaxase n=1 Tax=Planctomicrobium sp. SH527 TaxID=3448123 RepID=UPI003F5C341D